MTLYVEGSALGRRGEAAPYWAPGGLAHPSPPADSWEQGGMQQGPTRSQLDPG